MGSNFQNWIQNEVTCDKKRIVTLYLNKNILTLLNENKTRLVLIQHLTNAFLSYSIIGVDLPVSKCYLTKNSATPPNLC